MVSSGSGAGHCAGANRPGGLDDIVIDHDNDDINDNGDDKIQGTFINLSWGFEAIVSQGSMCV